MPSQSRLDELRQDDSRHYNFRKVMEEQVGKLRKEGEVLPEYIRVIPYYEEGNEKELPKEIELKINEDLKVVKHGAK